MKIKQLLFALFALIVVTACTEQDGELPGTSPVNNIVEIKRNWQNSTLNNDFFDQQAKISHYNFEKRDISNALRIRDVVAFRFVLGLVNDEIQVVMVGVNSEGREILKIFSNPYKGNAYREVIRGLKESPFTYERERIEHPVIGRHLLSYSQVYEYLHRWELALPTKNIEGMISHEGVRYRYFTMKRELMMEMISNTQVSCIALFFGLNDRSELTTVFLQKDNLDRLILQNSKHPLLSGEAVDFIKPCPSDCGVTE